MTELESTQIHRLPSVVDQFVRRNILRRAIFSESHPALVITSRFVLSNFYAASLMERFLLPLIIDYSSHNSTYRVLDVGCGAGAVSLTMARCGCMVTAVDINLLAALCCRLNSRLFGLENNISAHNADFELMQFSDNQFDLIVSNPPLEDLPSDLNLPEINDRVSSANYNLTTFDFLTNYWRNTRGEDLLDIIFRRSSSLLASDGKIAISYSNVERERSEQIIKKAAYFGFYPVNSHFELVNYEQLGIDIDALKLIKQSKYFHTRFNGIDNHCFCPLDERDSKTPTFIIVFCKLKMAG